MNKKIENKIKMKGGEKMKKMISGVMIMVAMCFAFVATANAGIRNSKHDFSAGTSYSSFEIVGENRMCIFCHTPHNAQEAIPLWNRSSTTTGYKLYTSSVTLTSATKASAIDSGNISYKCLTCHDGTVGIASGAVNGNVPTGADKTVASGDVGFLDTDLSNDHPIGFDYVAAASGAANGDDYIRKIATATANGMKFYKDSTGTNQMECASCHDVHNNAFPNAPRFLRTTIAGSALCLACHDK